MDKAGHFSFSPSSNPKTHTSYSVLKVILSQIRNDSICSTNSAKRAADIEYFQSLCTSPTVRKGQWKLNTEALRMYRRVHTKGAGWPSRSCACASWLTLMSSLV